MAAGGFLTVHVTQSLFVVSTAVFAYLGLVACCVTRRRAVMDGRVGNWLLAAWREHRRAHLAAALLLILFASPMLIDLAWGRQSNFAAILRCLHDGVSDRKSLARSFTYFLQYGAYAPYETGSDRFGYYDRAGFVAYVRAHALFYVGWLLVLALMLLAPFAFLWTLTRRRHQLIPAAFVGTRRFLACAALIGTLGIGLTLYWGTHQAGPMLYFNSWFNFAIYYFCLLVAVGLLCTLQVNLPAHDAGPAANNASPPWTAARAAGVGAVVLTALLCANRLRIHPDHLEASQAMHRNVERAIAEFDAVHPGVEKGAFLAGRLLEHGRRRRLATRPRRRAVRRARTLAECLRRSILLGTSRRADDGAGPGSLVRPAARRRSAGGSARHPARDSLARRRGPGLHAAHPGTVDRRQHGGTPLHPAGQRGGLRAVRLGNPRIHPAPGPNSAGPLWPSVPRPWLARASKCWWTDTPSFPPSTE